MSFARGTLFLLKDSLLEGRGRDIAGMNLVLLENMVDIDASAAGNASSSSGPLEDSLPQGRGLEDGGVTVAGVVIIAAAVIATWAVST